MLTPLKARYDRLAETLSVVARWVFAPSQSEPSPPSPNTRFPFLPGAGVVAVVALLLATFLLPYLNTGYTTNDDMQYAYLPYSSFVQFAHEHGRFYFMSLFGLTASGAHVFREMVFTRALSLSAIILNFILFGWLVRRLAGNTAITWLTLLTWTTLQRDSWEHYLITSYSLIFTVPLSLFFLSLIACDHGIEKKSKRLLFLSAILYALTLHHTEMFFPLALCFLPILYRYPTASWKSLSFHVMFFLLTLLLYAAWRFTHPSIYTGNVLATSFRFTDSLRTLFTYSLSLFPAYPNHAYDGIPRFFLFGGVSLNPLHGLPDLSAWLQNLRYFEPAWLLRATLAAGIVWTLLRRFAVSLSFSMWIVIGTFAACLIFLPNLLLALTPKYQMWVREADSRIYLYSYFSFFGICFLMGAIACHLTAIARIGLVRTTIIGILATLAFLGTLKISAWNDAEIASKVYSHRKWELLDDFLLSPSFRNIPTGSIFYAPSLMTHRYDIAAAFPGYWSEYIRYKTGKSVLLLTGKEEMEATLRDNSSSSTPRYYLKYSVDYNRPDALLLFAPILDLRAEEDMDGPIRFFGNEADLFFRPLKIRRILLFQDETGDRAIEVSCPSSADGFAFHLKGKGICLNSVFAVNNPDALRFEDLHVNHGPGFLGIEQNRRDR